jgi:carboxypeptidase family protein
MGSDRPTLHAAGRRSSRVVRIGALALAALVASAALAWIFSDGGAGRGLGPGSIPSSAAAQRSPLVRLREWREGADRAAAQRRAGPLAQTPAHPAGSQASERQTSERSGLPSGSAPGGAAMADGEEGRSTTTSSPNGPRGPESPDAALNARLSGRVVDTTGGPVSGAHVSVSWRRPSMAPASALGGAPPLGKIELISAADGSFGAAVPAGDLLLEAAADAYATSRKSARAPAADVILRLVPGSIIEGRVQREDASPVSDASVEVLPRSGRQASLSAETDPSGAFRVTGISAGIVSVVASATGLQQRQEWLRLGVAETSAPLVFTLSAAATLRGVVRVNGAPCASGSIQLAGPLTPPTPLDAGGEYRLDGVAAGQHWVTAQCAGAAPRTLSVTIGAGAARVTELDVELDAGLALAGSVTRKSGEPVAGVSVLLLEVPSPDPSAEPSPRQRTGAGMAQAASECTSDATGNFECGGLSPGWYEARTRSFDAAASKPVQVNASLSPRVSLIVNDTAEIRVTLAHDPRAGGGSAGVFARGSQPFSFLPRVQGELFVFENLALGRYRIGTSRALGEGTPGTVSVELSQPGQVVQLELSPPDSVSIAGLVLDEDAQPLPDAWVSASPSQPDFPMYSPTADPVLSRQDGSFELTGLAPGRYVVSVVHPLGEAWQLDVPGGQRDLKIVLESYGEIVGSVILPDGQPAARFSVLAMRQPIGEPSRFSGERGAWSAPWLAPGAYQLVIMSDAGGARAEVQVRAGQTTRTRITLEPALAGSGILRTAKPAP